MTQLLFFIISFLASIVGAICGIGGGVIIKPTLDAFGLMSVSAISFLSGCTVLAMSAYSVGRAMLAREREIDTQTSLPLAIGAAVGGVLGKQLYQIIQNASAQPQRVGGVQAVCLAVITLLTLAYTLLSGKIRTRHVKNAISCAVIGLALGMCSAFLGIGGGPINLMVLSFFFSMGTKKAAQNSLYVILFSQITSLMTTLGTATVPAFDALALALMVLGGVLGAILGRKLNKRISERQVRTLFCVFMVIIIGVSVMNAVKYL